MWKGLLAISVMVLGMSQPQSLLAQPSNQKISIQGLEELKKAAKPYLIPKKHRFKPILDDIFSKSRVLENEQSLKKAGFTIFKRCLISRVILAKHPRIPGYLFKLYLDSETQGKYGKPGAHWLVQRCVGAARVRKVIQQNKLTRFIVPKKWIYALPEKPKSHGPITQPFVVLAQYIPIVDKVKTRKAWQEKFTKAAAKELFCLLANGCGSLSFALNIPYVKQGKFALIDTEYPKRTFDLSRAKRFMSLEMSVYWDHLMLQHQAKKEAEKRRLGS